MIKAIYIDIDGTLEWRGKIEINNILSLKKAAKQGIKIILCTGRSIWRVEELWNKININNNVDYIILNNGAFIINNRTKEIIFESIISEKTFNGISEFVKEKNYTMRNSGINKFYMNKKSIWYYTLGLFYLKRKNKLETNWFLNKYENENAHKIGVLGSILKKTTDKILIEMKSKFDDVEIAPSGPGIYLEITNKGISKASGAKILSKIIGVNLKESAAIGDSMNDLEIFKVVGLPIAMKNADSRLKKFAKFETDHSKKAGVSKAVENILKNNYIEK